MDGRNKNRKHSYAGGPPKGAVLLVMVLAAVIILAIAAFRVAADSRKPASSPGKKPTPAPTYAASSGETKKDIGILEYTDTETKTLQIYGVGEEKTLWLTYTSATDITDKYGQAIVAGQLIRGDILEIEYEASGGIARSVAIAKEVWEHPYQTGLVVSTKREMLTVGNRNFIYSDALHIYNNSEMVELSSLLEQDSITLKGIGSEVYVIVVERGHGYLTLKEGQDYVGGSILVNNQYISQITEEMKLTLKEGTFEVTVENDDLKATLETTIARDQTTVLDLTEYVRVPDPVGRVTFRIQPIGALLFINNENTFYGQPVELPYGIYTIQVESGGYISYEGVLKVESAASELAVSLPEAPVEEEPGVTTEPNGGQSEENPSGNGQENNSSSGQGGSSLTGDGSSSNEGSTSSGNSSDNSSENITNDDGSYRTDDDHNIIIYSDDEVEIYLDGDYMGVIEEGKAEFEKFIGTFELELVCGEEKKSYVIQVDDDGEDFIFRRYFNE